jgi:hypothetical protein
MIILVYFLPNTSGLVCAKNLRKWAEKAFASSTLVFHDLALMKILLWLFLLEDKSLSPKFFYFLRCKLQVGLIVRPQNNLERKRFSSSTSNSKTAHLATITILLLSYYPEVMFITEKSIFFKKQTSCRIDFRQEELF